MPESCYEVMYAVWNVHGLPSQCGLLSPVIPSILAKITLLCFEQSSAERVAVQPQISAGAQAYTVSKLSILECRNLPT